MMQTQLTVETAAIPQAARQSGKADTAVAQTFQALLQNALQSEETVLGETAAVPREAKDTLDDRPMSDEGAAKADPIQPEKTQPERRADEEEAPDEALVLVAVPVEMQPVPELVEELVEVEAPVIEAGPVHSQPIEWAEPEALPETRQPEQSAPVQQPEQAAAATELPDIPILSAELIVDEAEPLLAAQVSIQIQPQTEEPEQQSRFDDMLARASEQLQSAEQAEPVTEMPVEQTEQPQAETGTDSGEGGHTAQTATAQTAETPRKTGESPELTAILPDIEPAETEAVPFETVERQELFPTPAEQIEARVIENLETQRMEFHMQLQPQELGRVDVRMVLEGGKLAVQIVAATPKAAEALRGQTEGLVASMRLANIDLDSVQVVQETQAQEQHMYGAFDMMGQSGQPGDQSEGGGSQSARTAQPEAEDAADGQAILPEQLLDTAV